MDSFPDVFDIKKLIHQQNLQFRMQARANNLGTAITAKRNFFLEKSMEREDISSVISLFFQSIKLKLVNEMIRYIKLINNFLYDCPKEEISNIYFQLSHYSIIVSLFETLKKTEGNFVLINEISMLFVNLSALLEDSDALNEFFRLISLDFLEIFETSQYLEMKTNIMIILGNLTLRLPEIGRQILTETKFMDEILQLIKRERNELNEVFFDIMGWFLDIFLDINLKNQNEIRMVSIILMESNETRSFKKEVKVGLMTKIFENSSENEVLELFCNTQGILSDLLVSLSFEDTSKAKETNDTLTLLTTITANSEIIPYILKTDMIESISKEFSSFNTNHKSKILDLLLNLFCYSSQTIKHSLPQFKQELSSLVFYCQFEEIRKKAIKCLVVCLICGDEEICLELLTKELFQEILRELNDLDIEHVILMLKAVEKILYYGKALVCNSDEQNPFFEVFCNLQGEELLEKLCEHNSKFVSFLALHIIDSYF